MINGAELPRPLDERQPAACACSSPARRRLPRRFTARAARFKELLALSRAQPLGARERASAEADLKRFLIAEYPAALKKFLRQMGAATDDLLAALSPRFEAAHEIHDAPWYQVLATVLTTKTGPDSDTNIVGATGLRKPLYPFLNWAEDRIDEWREVYDAEWGSLRPSLLERVSDQLFAVAYKAFVLEANILRIRGDRDVTSNERSFVDQFAQAAAQNRRYVQRLYLTYPALARLMAATLLHWWENTQELFDRLQADAGRIETCVLRQPLGVLQSIEDSLSDPHDGGKRVLILRVSGGQKLVYKPRPAQIDVAYQRFVEWLNAAGVTSRLRVLRVIAGDDYGWMEFVDAEPLPTAAAACQFYMRHGIHLAVLYLMKATDFHSENIIASGDQPMLVDLETLMHGDVKLDENYPLSYGQKVLGNSVFACGLLPGWVDADPLMPGPDLSGIGTREGQFYRDKGEVLEHGDDGAIRLVRKKMSVAENPNRPMHGGRRINPALYCDDIIRGFDSCYRVLQANAGALRAADGPLATLLKAKARHVALPTSVYASLLRHASHPDFLARSIHRELIFAILAQRSVRMPSSASLLRPELDALFDGDVPKFTGFAETTSLFDQRDVELTDFLQSDAATSIRRRIDNLTDDNLKLQKEIIRSSMATLRRQGEPGAEMAPPHMAPTEAMSEDEILREVRLIAGMIRDRAIVDGRRIDWVEISQADNGRSSLSAVGTDLYEGVSGIGLFLGYAGRRLQDDRLLTAARQCGAATLHAVQRDRSPVLGGYSGRGSAAYGLLHIATVLNERAWLDCALEVMLRLSDDIGKDTVLDIIAGSAGRCGVLLAAYRFTRETSLLDAAVRAAEHLLANRVACKTGYGWPSRNSIAPLTGFAHGAAGIGWALIQVGYLAHRQEFVAAGMMAFAYERSVYSSTLGWPDFRGEGPEEAAAPDGVAWCHGGPGIGLSRAALPPACIGEAELIDIAKAVTAIRNSTLAPTDCLCHGELGNIELLLTAAGPTSQPTLPSLARRRATGAVERRRAIGAWRCGAVPNEQISGLLIGLAGIGYGLLRCYFPDETPSILVMAPPAANFAHPRGSSGL